MIFTIILIGLYTIKSVSYVLPSSLQELNNQNDNWTKYIRATLQSSGYLPYDEAFINDYLNEIYDFERYEYERCYCMGCFVNNHCIECLNKNVCTKLSGTYCE